MSRGFLCTLGGIAITIYAWFGSSLWPAWPALALLDLAFSPAHPFSALSANARSTVVVILIGWNVAVWAAALRASWWIVERTRDERGARSSS